MDHLTSNYGVVDEITKLLDAVELIVVPFTNPDGYEFTWTSTRLWRKNRSPAPAGSNCEGMRHSSSSFLFTDALPHAVLSASTMI